MAYTLPSGIEVEMQEMTGREEALLTNKRLAMTGESLNKVLKNCTLSIDDNIDVKESDILDLLSGDRMAMLIHLRQISFGDECELNLRCGDGDCNGVALITVDLNDVSIKKYGEKREFEITLPSGKKVTFVLLNGHMEKRLAALEKPDVHASMLMRVKCIDGRPPNKDTITEMSARDINALRSAMEDVDAGPDTLIETSCPKCGARIRTRLEGESGFFFPSLR